MGSKINPVSSEVGTEQPKTEVLGAGVGFRRIRRITGYLSEDVAFNNGKKAELHDRIKHMSMKGV